MTIARQNLFEKKVVEEDNRMMREEDMINQLPDCLLCEILFHLPTKDVVKTSLLCRRWRNIWQSVPGLDLEFNGYLDFAKYEFFDRFMSLNTNLCLQTVKLRYFGYGSNAYNQMTLNTVVKQKIQSLDVGPSISNRICDMVSIPPTIYTSCESLVSLKLNRAFLPRLPDSVSLPCLKTMDLQGIMFLHNLGMEMLISVCPALETLTMDVMYGAKVSSQSLLSFSLTTNKVAVYQEITQVVMQTPRLKYLKLNHHLLERIIINDLSSLVQLNLEDLTNFSESFPNFLTLMSRVRNLTISFDLLQVIRRFSKSKPLPQFHKLSILSVKGMEVGSWENLLVFLETCPNLKSLVMGFNGKPCGINFFDVPHCLLSSVEFVEIKAIYLAGMEKIASYFMKNSTVLKKLILCLDHIKVEDYVILNRLFALSRRSNTCEVVVPSRTSETYKPLSLLSCDD